MSFIRLLTWNLSYYCSGQRPFSAVYFGRFGLKHDGSIIRYSFPLKVRSLFVAECLKIEIQWWIITGFPQSWKSMEKIYSWKVMEKSWEMGRRQKNGN